MVIFCIQIAIQENKKTSRDVQISLAIGAYGLTLEIEMYFVASLLVNEMAGFF